MAFPKLKVTYFDTRGRAEAIRLAFFIGGVPFEDERLSYPEFTALRDKFPYGVLPVLHVDDEVLGESRAIFRYAGRVAGLYPTNNPLAAMMVEEIVLTIAEFGTAFDTWCMTSDPAVKQVEETKLLEEIIPGYMKQIDTRITKMKEHVTFQDESRLFIHEVKMFSFLRDMLQSDWLGFVPKDMHTKYKQWVAMETKVSNHPRVREWNAIQPTRPKTLKLTYFNFGGRAEPIRLALHLGGLPFEDNRLPDYETFLKIQPTLPYGHVPTLEIDGKITMAQSYGILRYVGSLSGLYPVDTDALAALRIDEFLAVLDQLQSTWNPSFAETDPEKLRMVREMLTKETIPKSLGGLDKRVSGWAKPYATGDKLTIADLAIFGIIDFLQSGIMTHVPTDLVTQFPSLVQIHSLVRELPRIQEYYETKKN